MSSTSFRDEVTTLEHPTLKVPYELLNKKFRTVQKVIDRDIISVSGSVSDLTSSLSASSGTPTTQVLFAIDNLTQKLQSFKKKCDECIEEEKESSDLCKVRLDHLKSYATGDQPEGLQTAWKKTRCNRTLVDHFLREGHYTSAMLLAQSCDIEHLVDVRVFQVCQHVEEGLRSHNTAPCLAWCHENRSKLRRLKSTLEYRVRLQDFTELVRQEKRLEAVKYARKHLSTGGDEMMSDLKSVMGLLAFSPQTPCKKYKRLFSLQRWDDLIAQFRLENLSLYQLHSHSILCTALEAGLSALKTPQCYKQGEHNIQCPVCSELFNDLASVLPYSHSSQSYLICNISGEPMNEHNPPMMLPNGYVYGEQALLRMSESNGGMIKCPRTSESFQYSSIKKVFVM